MEIVQLVISCGDRCHNRVIDSRFSELFRENALPLLKEKAVAVKNVAADVLLDRQSVIKLIPQPGNPSQNGIGFHALFNAEIRKPFHQICKRHLLNLKKA